MMKTFQILISLSFLFVSLSSGAQKKWTLDDCIQYGILNNAEVLKQKIRNEILKSDIKIAKGDFLPDATFNASQNFSLGNSFNVSTGVGQLESSSNSFSLASSVPIFNGFVNKYNLERSKKIAEQGQIDLKNIQFDISLNIVNKYLQVLFNQELLRAAKEQVVISEKNNKRIGSLYNEGFVSKREFLEIKATLARDKKESVLSMNKLDNSLIELKEFLGTKNLDDLDVKKVEDEELKTISGLRTEISGDAIENHPKIQSLIADVDVKKSDINLAKSQFYPRVNLNYSYSTNYFHILGRDDVVFNQETQTFEENGFFTQLNNNRTHFISISAAIPIFNRFKTSEAHKKAKEELKVSEIELENQRLLLKNKIRIALNDLNSAKSSLESAKVVLQAQRDAFSIAQRQYNNGGITNSEYLEVKTRLVQGESEYIQAKYEVIFKNEILKLYLNL